MPRAQIRNRFPLAGGLIGVLLAGCTALPPETTPAVGGPFNEALRRDYVELASASGYGNRMHFQRKALAAMLGERVGPDRVSSRELGEADRQDALLVRERLVEELRAGAPDTYPIETSQAQTGFDCWIADAQAGLGQTCRTRSVAALDSLGASGGRYAVFFAPGSTRVGVDGQANALNAASAARRADNAPIRVTGHTDRTGSAAANRRISERRAQAVASEMRAAGATSELIVTGVGEAQPLVPTDEGVAEAMNRRVDLDIGG